MKKRYIVIIACIWAMLIILLGFFGVLMLREFGVIKQPNPLKDFEYPWNRLGYKPGESHEVDTTESSYYVSMTPEQRRAAYHEYVDFEITHLVNDTDIEKIHKGMTVLEIVEMLGKPHDIMDFGDAYGFYLIWHTESGKKYNIQFDKDIYGAIADPERCMTQGVSTRDPAEYIQMEFYIDPFK